MIKVISWFFNKEEDGKLYKIDDVISHFTKEQEDKRIKLKQAVRVKPEKKERKPRRSKKEK